MNRKILVSLGVAAALLLYIFFRDYKVSDIPEIEKWDGDVTGMVIERPSGKLEFKRSAGIWKISPGDFPADSAVLNSMIKKVRDIKIIDLVSEEQHYTRYDLVPGKLIRVEVRKNSKTMRTLLIGKKTSTGRHTYVRVEGVPGVLLAEGTFHSEFEKKTEDIRDKEILRISKKSVESFDIACGAKKLSFYQKTEKKKDEKDKKDKSGDKKAKPSADLKTRWVCRGYERIDLDMNKVNSILGSLNPLKASGFRSEGKKGLPRALCSVKIKIMNRDISLEIYKKNKEGKYPVITSESPYVFFMDEWKVKKFIVKGINEIKK